MANRSPKIIGRKGTDISLRMVAIIAIFTMILVVLIMVIYLFEPESIMLENAYTTGSRLF